jgi:protein-disulfide isomerase
MRAATFFVALLAAAVATQATQVKSRGTPGAPVQLDVYSDYQCPACKALYERTLVPLMADYVDKGKVYLIHHEFPLAMHPHAMEAACYAVAASRLGKYEQAGDVLFRTQESWAASGNVDQTVCSILTPVEAKKVRALAKDPAVIAEVQQDIQAGRSANVSATPTLILTHRSKQYRLPGGASYEIMRRFIDQLLSN